MLLVICTCKVTKNNRNNQEKQREDKIVCRDQLDTLPNCRVLKLIINQI